MRDKARDIQLNELGPSANLRHFYSEWWDKDTFWMM